MHIQSCIHDIDSKYDKLDIPSSKIDLDSILYVNNNTKWYSKFLATQFAALLIQDKSIPTFYCS